MRTFLWFSFMCFNNFYFNYLIIDFNNFIYFNSFIPFGCWVFIATRTFLQMQPAGRALQVQRHLIVVASFVADHGLQVPGLQELWSMGLAAPQHVGSSRTGDGTRVCCIGSRFFITEPREKPCDIFFQWLHVGFGGVGVHQ